MADFGFHTHSIWPLTGGIGKVIAVRAADAKAKVEMPAERDGGGKSFKTDWLPVLQTVTRGACSFAMPRKDALVAVIFFDAERKTGAIIGGRYSDVAPAPAGLKAEDFFLCLEDGTRVQVAKDKGPLPDSAVIDVETPGAVRVVAKDGLAVSASAGVVVKTDETIMLGAHDSAFLEADKAVSVLGDTMVLQSIKTMTVKAGGAGIITADALTIKAPTIYLNGDVVITGGLTVANDAVIGNKSFLTHVHTPGVPTTSPPV